MDEAELKRLIEQRLTDGKLSCDQAHRIAEEFGIHLALIGRVCNQEGAKIKITGCMLGCF